MIVAGANNQALSSKDEDPSIITTDPIPVGDANYIQCTFNVPVLFTELATPTLSYKVQGGNDGQNWYDIGGFTDSATSPTTSTGPKEKGAEVTCAFVRVEFTLSGSGGSTVGITSANFDLHANFIHK